MIVIMLPKRMTLSEYIAERKAEELDTAKAIYELKYKSDKYNIVDPQSPDERSSYWEMIIGDLLDDMVRK